MRWLIWYISCVVSLAFSNDVLVKNYSPESSELPCYTSRNLEEFNITNLLLASDIEGNIHALNRNTGEVFWTLLGHQPLVSITSTSNYTERMENKGERDTDNTSHFRKRSASSELTTSLPRGREDEHVTWIIEPFEDGALYRFTPQDGLDRLPMTIKSLVLNSPFSFQNDKYIYTGSRETSLHKIDAQTGAIISSYGQSSSHDSVALYPSLLEKNEVLNSQSFDDRHVEDVSPEFTITLGKTVYQLTIYSDNKLLWNITYTTWGPDNINQDLLAQNVESHDGVYIAPFHDSSLLAIDSNCKSARWISNLPSIAVNVFDVYYVDVNSEERDRNINGTTHSAGVIVLPHPLQPKNSPNTKELSESVFIDRNEDGSWYAMSGNNYPSLVRSAPIAKYMQNERWRSPSVFKNPELTKISISGVHDPSFYKTTNSPNFANQATSFNNIRDIIGFPTPIFQNRNDHYPMPPNAVLPAQETPTHRTQNELSVKNYPALPIPTKKSFLSIDPPLEHSKFSSLKNLLLRCFENALVTMFISLVAILLSKLGLLPPLTQVLSKFGLFKRTQTAVELVDLLLKEENKVDIEILKKERWSRLQGREEDESLQDELSLSSDSSQDTSPTFDNVMPENSDDSKIGAQKQVKIITPEEDEHSSKTVRRRKRGARGGRKNKKSNGQIMLTIDQSNQELFAHSSQERKLNELTTDNSGLNKSNNLVISNQILGYGSHGTVVFRGTFENRPVAVKRMLIDFYDVASHEVNLLQESDDHSNVVRYYCSQQSDRFLYIALELCSCTLENIIEKPKEYNPFVDSIDPVQVLYQIANGLHHLHSLKIVHRDIKPQNILVVPPKSARTGTSKNKTEINSTPPRLLISDFGLCKKLEADQSSFRATTANAAGTSGWRAPELLVDESDAVYNFTYTNSKLSDEKTVSSMSSEPLVFDSLSHRRLTRSIDIFSAGCVFYYVLTGGSHPFGDRYLREGNIIKGEYSLALLDQTPNSIESKDLIARMIARDSKRRPDTAQILSHPFFWPISKKLDFLLKVSDRFEIERREPPSQLLSKLEEVAHEVFGKEGWYRMFPATFTENLGKYRKYNTLKLMDLLRAIRNKYHHYNDLPDDLNEEMSPIPSGFYQYFSRKFPNLLMAVYFVVQRNLKQEHVFSPFYNANSEKLE